MGIIEDTITPLSQAEINILHLESNVGDDGTYYIHLEGTASKGLDRLYKVMETLEKGIKLHMTPINSQIT
jgi:hypothetical protein